jgi:hypothetical protein
MVIWDWFVFFFVVIPVFLLWVFVFLDIFQNRPDITGGQRVLWLLLVLIVPILGSLIYLAARPPQTQHPTTV